MEICEWLKRLSGRTGPREGLLFSHIPKTAGTSFRRTFEQWAPGWKVYSDYEPQSRTTSGLIRTFYRDGDFSRVAGLSARRTLLAGHFPLKKYLPYYPADRLVTFLRDPVQRILSHYHDLRKRISYQGTLEDFVNEPGFQNVQARMLAEVPLEAMGFIGICEFYEESIDLFNRLYGFHLPVLQMNENQDKKHDFYFTSASVAEMISDKNQLDMAIYQKGMELLLRRRELVCRGQPVAYGALLRSSRKAVGGWACRPDLTGPVMIEILVNGSPVAIIPADQPCSALEGVHVRPQGVQAGFLYRFHEGLERTDAVDVRVAGIELPLTTAVQIPVSSADTVPVQ